MSNLIKPIKRSPLCKGMSKADYCAYRKKHVKLWESSGLSKTDYAAQIGISKDAMRDWVRSFGVTGTTKIIQPHSCDTDSFKPTEPVAHLVPVRIAPSNQSQSFKLNLPSGVILELDEVPPAIWLSELLRSIA